MKAIRLSLVVALAAVAVPLHGYAADTVGKTDMNAPKGDASASTEGEVRKVDKDTGKVTIKHGPIANLEMPGMTMVFRVAETAMLDQLKQGDKVKFRAEKINGALTVTKIEVAR